MIKEFRTGVLGLHERTVPALLRLLSKERPLYIPHSGSNILAYFAKTTGFDVYATDPAKYNRLVIEGVLIYDSPSEGSFIESDSDQPGWWYRNGVADATTSIRSWVDSVASLNQSNPFILASLGRSLLTISHNSLGVIFFSRKKKIRDPEDNPLAGIMTTPKQSMKQLALKDVQNLFVQSIRYYNQFRERGGSLLPTPPDEFTVVDLSDLWRATNLVKVDSILSQVECRLTQVEIPRSNILVKVTTFTKDRETRELLQKAYESVETHYVSYSNWVADVIFVCRGLR